MRGTSRFVTVCLILLLLSAVSASAGPVRSWRVVPLRAPIPSWYTEDLDARVAAAGARGVPLPAGAAVPLSSLAFVGIRPGQLVIFPESGSLCSSNFVFTGGGGYAIGSAGHCAKVGDRAVMVLAPLGLAEIGTVIDSHDGGVGNDFLLIGIAPEMSRWVSPSLAFWGGPTGVYGGAGPAPIHHTGWGLVVGAGGTPRAGLGLVWRSDEWRFEAATAPGDSGSGAVVTGGLGAGNITHLVIDTREDAPAYMTGTAMGKLVQMAGGSWQLATCAPIPWPLPGCPPV